MLNRDDELGLLDRDARECERTKEFDLDDLQDEAERNYRDATTEAREHREREARQVRECHEIGGPETW